MTMKTLLVALVIGILLIGMGCGDKRERGLVASYAIARHFHNPSMIDRKDLVEAYRLLHTDSDSLKWQELLNDEENCLHEIDSAADAKNNGPRSFPDPE